MNRLPWITWLLKPLLILFLLASLGLWSGLLQAQGGCHNLAINGDFQAGDSGFIPGLGPSCDAALCLSSRYCVGNEFRAKCNLWPDDVWDHTLQGPNGRFMIIDGSTSGPADVWSMPNVNVTPGVLYEFSFWVISVYGPGQQQFDLDLLVDGVAITPPITIAQPASVWVQYTYTWLCPTGTTSVPLTIRQASGGAFRDFGLDDISFTCISCEAAFVPEYLTDCGLVQFINQSTGPLPISVFWDFGDPLSGAANTSTTPNPVHQFSGCGTYDVCLTITSANGCVDIFCTQVTITDTTPPTALCAPGMGFELNPDCTLPLNVGMIDAGSSDNCFIKSIEISETELSGCGVFPVTLTVTDWCNNVSTCTTEIQTTEVEPPMIVCPPSVVVNALPDACTITVNGLEWLSLSDNCGVPTVAYEITGATQALGAGPANGTLFQQGVSTVTYTATDPCGNTASCSFEVIVSCEAEYCACASDTLSKPNLVANGNFASGNAGFSSDLNPSSNCGSDSYLVADNFTDKCSGWPSVSGLPGGGNNNFLIVDGDTGSPATIWEQQLNIVPGMTYCFSFSTASVYPVNQQNFNLDIVVYDGNGLPIFPPVGNAHILQTSPPWSSHSFTWTCPSPAVGPFTLAINQVSGGAFQDFGIDDLCFTKTAPSCCANYDAFCMAVENAASLSVDNDNCKATLNIGSLPDCDYIERIEWGDGHTDSGQFVSGDMPMHTYAGSGTYVVNYLAIETDPVTGLICFEKFLSDTITLDCSCECITGDMTLTQGDSVHQMPCNLHGIPNNLLPVLDCSATPLSISGNFGCYTGAGVLCPSVVNWTLTDQLLNTTVGSGTLPIVLPTNLLGIPGTYSLSLSTLCPGASDSCICNIRWIQPPCDTCFCTMGTDLGTNLVSNGNFGLGDNYFSNLLSLDPFGSCMDDAYLVAGSFMNKCNLWPPLPIGRPDGNLGSNNFLIIDGGGANPMTVWSQQVNVVPNMTYLLSFWTASVYPPSQQTFWLDIVFDDNSNPAQTKNELVSQSVGSWVHHSIPWTCPSGFGPSITLSINANSGGAFRDFGIDDICFTKVNPEDNCCDENKNVVTNGHFDGLTPGDLAPLSTPWYAASLTPQYSLSDGCQAPGMIQMWGNGAFGEVMGQNSIPFIFKNGWTYRVSFCAKFINISNLPTQQANGWFNLQAGNGTSVITQTTPHCPSCTTIGQSPVLNQDNVWVPVVLPNWTSNGNYNNLFIDFQNSILNINSDSIAWGRIDDICIEVVDSVNTNSCCDNFDDFCMAVENAVSLSVDNDNCKATLNIGSLPDCDYIERVEWGDGHTDSGQFVSGDMPMHTYAGSGTYVVSYLAIETDPVTGLICFEKILSDTINVVCESCVCGTFSALFFPLNRNVQGTAAFCDSQEEITIACPSPGNSIQFTGLFQCAGPNCPPTAQVSWELIRLPNTLVASNSTIANPYFGISILPAWYATPGSYELRLVGHCGQQECPCIVKFRVDCPDPCPCSPPDIEALSAAVNQGFSVVKYPTSCKACFVPVALSDCETIEWHLNTANGPLIGSSVGNNAICHTFNGPGTYTVVMVVTRRKSDGSICEVFTKSQTVTITCLIISDCTGSDFPNPAFSLGAVGGGLLSGGMSNGWGTAFGEPVVVEGAPGSFDAWTIQLSGNFDSPAVLTSLDPICVERSPGMLSMRMAAKRPPYDEGRRQRPCDVVKVSGSGWSPSVPASGKFAFIPLDLLDSSEWVEIEIPYDLTTRTDFDACGMPSNNGVWIQLSVEVTNALVSSQGGEDTHSYVQIDHLCFNGTIVALKEQPYAQQTLRVYPNPNSGAFVLELPQAATAGMHIRISSLVGQLLWEKQVQAGSKQQALDVSLLPAGLYFVQLVSDGRVVGVERFVKQ